MMHIIYLVLSYIGHNYWKQEIINEGIFSQGMIHRGSGGWS
jgi:hypothetical protein